MPHDIPAEDQITKRLDLLDGSVYDIDAPLELPRVKRRDERDFPDTLMRYTNPWAICAMQDRHWLISEVERLRGVIREMEHSHREDMRSAVAEERRSIETGEPYGTY